MTFYPTWVNGGVVSEFETIIATLDSIASSNALDPVESGNFSLAVAAGPAVSASTPAITASIYGWANAASALYQAVPTLVSPLTGIDPSLPAGCIGLAEGLAAIIDPLAAAAAFALVFDSTAQPGIPSSGTPNRIAYATNAALIARFSRIVYLCGYAEALALATFNNRPDAITARADAVGRFDSELALCSGAADADLADQLTAMRNAVATYLTAAIIAAPPILDVTGPALPGLVWAWIIYQDPTRASDLIARNAIPVAEYFPLSFEAAAP